MKISQKKQTLKEALRRRAQRRALKEAVAEYHGKETKKHFVLEEELKNKATKFFKESDDEEVIEIDDEEGDVPVDSDDVEDIEVDTDEEPAVEDDPSKEIKDAIRILAANAGMTAADFEEPEETVEEGTELMSAAEFFNQGDDDEDNPEESKEVCEDDEEEKPAEETPVEGEPTGDETTDLSVDTEVADLSGATDLSSDLTGATEVSGTVDNPANPEEEETAETAKKLADMTPEDWFKLLNQI